MNNKKSVNATNNTKTIISTATKIPPTEHIKADCINVTNEVFMNWPENTGCSTKHPEWLSYSEPLVLNWTTLSRSNRRINSHRKPSGRRKIYVLLIKF